MMNNQPSYDRPATLDWLPTPDNAIFLPPETPQAEALPPPWKLRGDGYIFIYRFPREFTERHGFIAPPHESAFVGGLGAVMLVDYHSAPCGPYRELLFIPGKFQVDGREYYSITKIYVSSQASIDNGRANWGIPKEYADFDVTAVADRHERISLRQQGLLRAEWEISHLPLLVPITTALIPTAVRSLVHGAFGKWFVVAPGGWGWLSAVRLHSFNTDPTFFPPVGEFKPAYMVRARNFHLTFPAPEIKVMGDSHSSDE
ncbi:MAG: hypothetical protein OHK0023_27890 [Anaerolineae bacterium]